MSRFEYLGHSSISHVAATMTDDDVAAAPSSDLDSWKDKGITAVPGSWLTLWDASLSDLGSTARDLAALDALTRTYDTGDAWSETALLYAVCVIFNIKPLTDMEADDLWDAPRAVLDRATQMCFHPQHHLEGLAAKLLTELEDMHEKAIANAANAVRAKIAVVDAVAVLEGAKTTLSDDALVHAGRDMYVRAAIAQNLEIALEAHVNTARRVTRVLKAHTPGAKALAAARVEHAATARAAAAAANASASDGAPSPLGAASPSSHAARATPAPAGVSSSMRPPPVRRVKRARPMSPVPPFKMGALDAGAEADGADGDSDGDLDLMDPSNAVLLEDSRIRVNGATGEVYFVPK